MIADLVSALRRYKNVIAEGVPGTGKTFAIDGIIDKWATLTGRELGACSVMTMHPSTGYEEFLEGIRPIPESGTGGGVDRPLFNEVDTPNEPTHFRLQRGFFLEECARALADPDRDYLIVLDELNRANVPRVLGDILLLLEPSKRARYINGDWDGLSTVLPNSGSRLIVPDNLYVLGTMNTTDRSVTPLDAALRRRFAFIRLNPVDPGQLLTDAADLPQEQRKIFGAHVAAWDKLNRAVLGPTLGPDGVLGHSYLYGLLDELRDIPASDPLIERVRAIADESTHTAWFELGRMTGGSGNQFNLAQAGRQDPHRGPVHVFMPDGSPADTEFALEFDADTFEGCELRYPSSERASGTWQVFLKGKTADGEPFQRHHEHAFSDSVAVFGWDAAQSDLVHAAVLPFATIPTLQQLSSEHDHTPNGKAFGVLGTLRESDTADVAGAAMWRYEILPQLFESLLGYSAEELLDPALEQAWLERHPSLAGDAPTIRAALAEFRTFLGECGLAITLSGVGLGRAPIVSSIDAAALASALGAAGV